MADPTNGRPEPAADAGIDEIEADIEATRKELGQTVQALSNKLDVKERAREKAAETKDRTVHRAQEITHDDRVQRGTPIAAIVVTLAVVGLIIWRRRH